MRAKAAEAKKIFEEAKKATCDKIQQDREAKAEAAMVADKLVAGEKAAEMAMGSKPNENDQPSPQTN